MTRRVIVRDEAEADLLDAARHDRRWIKKIDEA
jgi:hypothetical protein